MTDWRLVKGGGILLKFPRQMLAPVLAILALFALAPVADAKPLEASIVIDAGSGAVISSNNADAATYPASLTKMMTLYLLFEAMRAGKIGLDDQITFSPYSASRPPTSLAADPGDRIRVETAILAVVVRSANDVAAAIGERLAGTEYAFARKMTAKARELGMNSTTFRNASGLPDPAQKTTARDMAILGLALLRDFPEYYGYFSRTKFTYGGVAYTGHNRLLGKFDGADGIKTGYIRASGFNLVSSAERDGVRLVGVVLGGSSPSSRDRWMARLLESGFTKPGLAKTVTIASKAPVKASSEIDDDPVATLLASAEVADIIPQLRPAGSAPAAPDKQQTVNVWNGNSGEFGIQVGAFAKESAAQKAAHGASDAIPEILGDARIIVDTQKTEKGGTLYRARVIGLSRDAAERACKDLSRRSTDCMVLKTGNNLAMGG